MYQAGTRCMWPWGSAPLMDPLCTSLVQSVARRRATCVRASKARPIAQCARSVVFLRLLLARDMLCTCIRHADLPVDSVHSPSRTFTDWTSPMPRAFVDPPACSRPKRAPRPIGPCLLRLTPPCRSSSCFSPRTPALLHSCRSLDVDAIRPHAAGGLQVNL